MLYDCSRRMFALSLTQVYFLFQRKNEFLQRGSKCEDKLPSQPDKQRNMRLTFHGKDNEETKAGSLNKVHEYVIESTTCCLGCGTPTIYHMPLSHSLC